MIDVCTHCECAMEDGVMKKYKLSCKRITCPKCPMVTIMSCCHSHQGVSKLLITESNCILRQYGTHVFLIMKLNVFRDTCLKKRKMFAVVAVFPRPVS